MKVQEVRDSSFGTLHHSNGADTEASVIAVEQFLDLFMRLTQVECFYIVPVDKLWWVILDLTQRSCIHGIVLILP